VALSGLVAVAPALAADIEPIVEEPAAYDWSGCYIGFHVGYGEADFDGGHELEEESEGDPPELAKDLDVNGVAGGGHIGCNFQTSSALVLGIEGDATFMDWQDDIHQDDGSDVEGIEAEVDLLASARLRVGFALDRLLIFATGGAAFADAEFSAFEIGEFNSTVDFDDIGGVVGGGIEYAVADNVSFRAEGLWYFFNDKQDFDDDGTGPEEGDFGELEDAFVVRVGVSWFPWH
jgi:outer membrane immunogenic protein